MTTSNGRCPHGEPPPRGRFLSLKGRFPRICRKKWPQIAKNRSPRPSPSPPPRVTSAPPRKEWRAVAGGVGGRNEVVSLESMRGDAVIAAPLRRGRASYGAGGCNAVFFARPGAMAAAVAGPVLPCAATIADGSLSGRAGNVCPLIGGGGRPVRASSRTRHALPPSGVGTVRPRAASGGGRALRSLATWPWRARGAMTYARGCSVAACLAALLRAPM